MDNIKLITVDASNVHEHGIGCIQNKKHPGYNAKMKWLEKEFPKGLRIKLLKNGKKTAGFLEYTPGEYAWRPVNADSMLFIHCIWVYTKEFHGKGFGSQLIQSAIEDARDNGYKGVAAVCSNGSWLADRRLFEQNGFIKIDEKERFDLMYYQISDCKPPAFVEWEKSTLRSESLQLLFANQCPANMKSIIDITKYASDEGLKVDIIKLEDSIDAQNAPTGYGVFNITYQNNIIVDHYISKTRFNNIVRKELKISGS